MQWYKHVSGHFYECSEDSAVYFDPASGDTHLLGSFAAHVIKHISVEPMAVGQIIEKISADIEPDELPEVTAALPALLDHLVSLSIISVN